MASREENGVWERRYLLGIHVLITEYPAGNSSLQLEADLPALKGSNTNTSRYEQLALNSEVKCALSHTPNIRFSYVEPSFPARSQLEEAQLRGPGPGTEQNVAIACALSGTQNIRFSKEEPSPQITRVLPWTLPLGRKRNCSTCSGLSSSSTLVCCVALVTVYANKLDNLLDKKRLVELHVHTKHYIGTEGGGMDAEPRKAKMIEFNPIRLSNVCLPVGTQFVISNCLVNANKVVFAVFNERVMECHLAAQALTILLTAKTMWSLVWIATTSPQTTPSHDYTPGADPGGGLEVQGDSGDRETEEGTAGSC
eukprot:Em0001g1883a